MFKQMCQVYAHTCKCDVRYISVKLYFIQMMHGWCC